MSFQTILKKNGCHLEHSCKIFVDQFLLCCCSFTFVSVVQHLMTTFIAPTLHILSPVTIHAGTLGTYCSPKAYIVTGDIDTSHQANRAIIYVLNFDTVKVVTVDRTFRQH